MNISQRRAMRRRFSRRGMAAAVAVLVGSTLTAPTPVAAEISPVTTLGSDLREVDLGKVTLAPDGVEQVTITLTEGDSSFMVVVDAEGRDDAVAIDEIVAPDGTKFTDTFSEPREGFGSVAQQWPVLATQTAAPGEYVVTVAGVENQPLQVTALIKRADITRTQVLDVNFWVVSDSDQLSTDGTLDPAKTDALRTAWRDKSIEIFGGFGIEVGEMKFTEAPDEIVAQFRNLPLPSNESPPDRSQRALCEAFSKATGDERALHFALVDTIPDPDDPDGTTLGNAAGIPGAVIEADWATSCVIASGEDGTTFAANATTAWHEAGHLLGLNHTSESSGDAFDYIPDTPECPISFDTDMSGATSDVECASRDGGNFMFHDTDNTGMTDGQAFVLKHNPLLSSKGSSEIVSLSPARFFESRAGQSTLDSLFAGGGQLAAGSETKIVMAGRGGVPATGASAVVANVTAINPDARGFATTYPCDERPLASSLNYAAAGAVVGNEIVAKLSDAGELCVFTSAATNLTIDVVGYVPDGSPITSLVPARLFESRVGQDTVDDQSAGVGRLDAGEVATFQVTGRGGVSENGVSGIVMNLTAINPDGRGFLTAYPCGDRPLASSLNYSSAGTVAGNEVVSKLSDDGRVCIFASAATDLTVDAVGFVPETATTTTLTGARFFDSRSSGATIDDTGAAGGRLVAGSVTTVKIGGRGDVPAGADAAIMNITAVNPSDAGFITVYPCATRPLASSLNYDVGAVAGNEIIAKLGAGGTVCVYSFSETDLTIDVTGYVPV